MQNYCSHALALYCNTCVFLMAHTIQRLRHKRSEVCRIGNGSGETNWVLWGTRTMIQPRSEWDQRESRERGQPFKWWVWRQKGPSALWLTVFVGTSAPVKIISVRKTVIAPCLFSWATPSVCCQCVWERESCVYSGESYTTRTSCCRMSFLLCLFTPPVHL